jgi:polysaccharide export outer membrane protein
MFKLCKGLLLAIMSAAILSAPVKAQAPTAPAAPVPYRINPGDELEIHVWGEERLQREVRVLPDGTFAFPLVGQVNALQRVPREVEQEITERLKGQFRDQSPQVTVSVKNPAGLQFSVIGKVRSPGTFTPGRYVNALEALSFAGGTTEFARVGDIVIIRNVGGRLTKVELRLNRALQGSASDAELAAIPQLQVGDTVVVP